MKRLKYWDSFLFLLIILFGFAATYFGNIKPFVYAALFEFPDYQQGNTPADFIDAEVAVFEDIFNESIVYKEPAIELYGGIQRLLGNRVVSDVLKNWTVYRTNTNSLGTVDPPLDTESAAKGMEVLHQKMLSRNIPLVYVQLPIRNSPYFNDLPEGVVDYSRSNTDHFLEQLNQFGIQTYDLRASLHERVPNEEYPNLFYRTDHHWTPQAGILAASILSEELMSQFGAKWQAENYDLSRYTVEDYGNIFLGSLGRRLGSLYLGVDRFEVVTPAFDTRFSYQISDREPIVGTLRQVYIDESYLGQKNFYENSPYMCFGSGDNDIAILENLNLEEGPTVLVIRDSYSCVLTPFLGLSCRKLVNIDLRSFGRPIDEALDLYQPDVVMVMYNPRAFLPGNETMFVF